MMRERERERERVSESEKERKRERRRTRTHTRSYASARRAWYVYVCVRMCTIRFFAVSIAPLESLQYAISLIPHSPSTCPSQIGWLLLLYLLSLPPYLSIYLSLSCYSHRPSDGVYVARGGTCVSAHRYAPVDRTAIERGFGWI
jgi:hypothetical protein